MANRNDRGLYGRGKNESRYTGYSGQRYDRGGGSRRRFRLNAVNTVLIAVVLVAGLAVVISMAMKGHSPNAAGGNTGAALQQTDTTLATATQSDSSQPAGAGISAPADTADAGTAAPTQAEATALNNSSSDFFTGGEVQTDDTTYRSKDLYVKITNVNENGQNYYIADCRMQDGNKLFRSFATDTYALHQAVPSSEMARKHGAVIAINGDYFGYRSDGIVIMNGKLYRSTPYYDVAAIYNDGTMKTFDKSEITADQLISDGAIQSLAFGPMLLDNNGKAIPTAQLKKRPPLVNPANPRTGIGYIESNHFVLIVVDGRGAGGSKGMTQTEFSLLFESLGCKSAYSLDGGGSATMVFMGKVINHPCDAGGERSVSDIVYFGESETDQANIDRFSNQ